MVATQTFESRKSASTAPLPNQVRSVGLRLHYLDGIRGLAALYVVVAHCYLDTYYGVPEVVRHTLFWTLSKVLAYGYVSVSVFIVLSGYCLMLPVVQSAQTGIVGGFFKYMMRRARRILPGYYGALFISLMLIACVPSLRQPIGLWASSLPALQTDQIVAHLLLVHNLNADWAHTIDYPLWSVATEWQIYFLFPLLLLPIFRRFGMLTTLCVAYFLGYLPHVLIPNKLDAASPWFIGLFATGMCAAAINFSKEQMTIRLQEKMPWALLCFCFFGITLVFAIFPKLLFDNVHTAIFDPCFGMGTGCALIFLTNVKQLQRNNFLLSILESKLLQSLGSYSYSLYLTHAPLLALFARYFDGLHPQHIVKLMAMECIALPASLLVAYFFSLIFERPFQTSRAK